MNKRSWLLGLVLLLALTVISPATAQQTEPPESGSFQVRGAHFHSSEFGPPSGAPTMFNTNPLEIPIRPGGFSYSSVSCANPAPFNAESFFFPGIETTNARYRLQGTLLRDGTLKGRLTAFVCEGEEEGDRIVFAFEGELTQVTAEAAQFVGTFEIQSGTGDFNQLEGSGEIDGTFLCLEPVLANNQADSCEDLGAYSDAIVDLTGTFARRNPRN